MSKTEPSSRIAYLDYCRILASVAVVVLHVSSVVLVKTGDLSQWWIANIFDTATRWSVPLFVMISGAVLLSPNYQLSAGHFALKRLNRLAWPVVFWCTLYFLFWHVVYHTPLALGFVVHTLVFDQPFEHLYFLFLIAELYAVAMLIRPWWQRLSLRSQVITTLAVMLVGVVWPATRFVGFLWIPFVGYFFAGNLLHQAVPRVKSNAVWWGLGTFIGMVTIAGLVYISSYIWRWTLNLLWYDFNNPVVMVTSICVFMWVKSSVSNALSSAATRVLSKLAMISFGVYLSHPLCLWVITQVWGNWWQLPALLGVPLVSFLTLSLAISVTLIITHIPGLKKVM